MNASQREDNAWIAEHVFGWQRGKLWGNGNGEWIVDGKTYPDAPSWSQTPFYSTDPAATFELESKCAEELGLAGDGMIVWFQNGLWHHGIADRTEWMTEAPTRGESACAFARKLFTK